jgi:hypothetical protein
MSQENVEVVRRARATYDGRDLVPDIREMVERLGPEPNSDAVLAFWAENPLWQYLHPDIEFDTSATGLAGSVARGPREVIRWWSDWVDVWESYVVQLTPEYRDLGEWVFASVDIRAQGRGGISAELRVFELYQVRDGKVAVYRTFLSERAALEAVGLRQPT